MVLSVFRYSQYKKIREQIDAYEGGLDAFSRGYEKFGFVKRYKFFLLRFIIDLT